MAVNVLLRLSSRGEALVAELLRVSDHVPPLFSLADKVEQKTYSEVIMDFAYLNTPALFEHRIESSVELVARDNEVWDVHGPIVCRVFDLFESIYKYIKDFVKVVADLRDGVYLQQTVEGVLLDEEGKQLMCEVLYLYGVLLLLLDARIDGAVRERIVVAYYRHKGQSAIESIEDMELLVRRTGYIATVLDRNGMQRRPPGYPEEYLNRLVRKLVLPPALVLMMIDRLRSEDMYSQIPSYPMPQHRSTALANTTNPTEIKRLYAQHTQNLLTVRKQLAHYLTEGVLTEEHALEHTNELLHCVRVCNVTIRWLVLHRRAKMRKLPVTDPEHERREAEQLLLVLMDTAQFECSLRQIYTALMDKKEEMWEASKGQVVERLEELSEAFKGDKILSRIGKDEQLQQWFTQLAEQVKLLEAADIVQSGRKLHHLIAALVEVEQFHQIEAALQLKQFLHETRDLLTRMIRVVSVRESTLVTLDVVCDMSYAWLAISDYAPLMRLRIQRNPFSVLKLRATFLKLASILESPLVRIQQAGSADVESVSQYYSSEVASFMRQVLQVIPENMFAILSEVVAIQANELRELPVKVARDALRDWSQLEPRHRLARATHRISVLTEGVLTMQTTLLGVVKVDPKELLTDGIRRELVIQLTRALQSGLSFKPGKPAELEAALAKLGTQLEGFRLALEYISDYVKINGLQLWQEELAAVINFYVEQERNAFLKRKVHSWQSTFTLAAEAANLAPPAAFEHSFFGRLVRELLNLTAPRRAIYSEALGGWTDAAGKEVLGGRLLTLLQRALSRCGLRGITSTLGFMVTAQLHRFVAVYHSLMQGELLGTLDRLDEILTPHATLPERPSKLYAPILSVGAKLLAEMFETIWRCGAAQLVRAHAASQLLGTTEIDCHLLHSILATADAALLSELRVQTEKDKEAKETEAKEKPGKVGGGLGANLWADGLYGARNEAAADLSPYLEAAGIARPKEQVMVVAPPLNHLALLLAIFTSNQLSKMGWSPQLAALVQSGKLTDDAIDGVPLVCGIATLLRQFHSSTTDSYIGYLSQFARAQLHASFAASSSKPTEVPADVCTLLSYLDLFSRHASVPVPALELYQRSVGTMQ